jgi:hypothetical protein
MTIHLSEHDEANIDAIMGGHGDWFSARLLRLIAKGDFENRQLLGSIYPEHYAAFMAWYVDQPVEGVPE